MERLAERYELGDALGQGRSTVYRALDTRLRREVAIKRVELLAGHEEVEQVRARALREAHASARLNNPCVVSVYDVVEESGAIWLVMELVSGPSLAQIVADQGPLPHRRAAAIGLGVLTALEAAHLVGVVHRDVKPANVLVPEGDRAKLTDFGVATIRDESRVTATGLIVGSPSYMAPEQATGGAITAATDMWALGALLYFAVEGEPPFQAGNALATATAVAHGDPRPPQHPGPLSPVIARLLTKAPANRPSAGEVRAALTRVARGVRRRATPAAPTASAAAPGASGAPATPGPSASPSPAPAAPVPSAVSHTPVETAAPPSPARRASSSTDAAAPPGSPDVGAAGEPASPRAEEVVPAEASGGDTAVHGAPPAAGAPAPPGAEPPPTARRRVSPALVAFVGVALVVGAVAAVPALSDGGGGSGGDGEAAVTTDPPGAADEAAPPATTAPSTTAPSTTEAPTTTAPSAAGLPAGWVPFADPAGTYTIGLPPNWQVRPTGADNRIDLVDPASGSFLRIEWTASPGDDAAQAWRDLAASFASRNDSYQEIGIGPAEYRDYAAALWEFRHRSDGTLQHTGNLGFVTAGRGYALMLRTPEELWDESQAVFDQFKQAFQPT